MQRLWTEADPDRVGFFTFMGGDPMANANVSLQILPRGKTDEEIYALVDEAIDVIRNRASATRWAPWRRRWKEITMS